MVCVVFDVPYVEPFAHQDARGRFFKVFYGDVAGLARAYEVSEVFWSNSEPGVFRGMHFQRPPYETTKIVFVVAGLIRDFLLDLRVGSSTYGVVREFSLGPEKGAIVVPKGFAHGFLVVEQATVVYLQDQPFNLSSYGGVSPFSLGLVAPSDSLIISSTDREWPGIEVFESPFRV